MEANGNPSYLNRLSEQLIDALTEHGALTLDELLIHGGGAFPTDVMSRLQAMCNSKSIVFDGSRYRRFGTVPAEGLALFFAASDPAIARIGMA